MTLDPRDPFPDTQPDAAAAPHEAAGYHLARIPRGEVGEASKVAEEAAEFADAVAQGVSVMALVELSDLYGAMDAYLARHHPGTSMEDLRRMSEVTRRAFLNGRR